MRKLSKLRRCPCARLCMCVKKLNNAPARERERKLLLYRCRENLIIRRQGPERPLSAARSFFNLARPIIIFPFYTRGRAAHPAEYIGSLYCKWGRGRGSILVVIKEIQAVNQRTLRGPKSYLLELYVAKNKMRHARRPPPDLHLSFLPGAHRQCVIRI